MKNYLKYIGKRVFYMFLTLFLIATITFFLMKLLPGSPYANEEQLTQAQLEIMNAKYGLDKPVFVQYLIYITGLFRLDFGESFQYNSTVANLIFSRVGPSFQLGFQALIFGTIVGSLLGMIAAMKQNTWVDTLATFFAIIGRSVPSASISLWGDFPNSTDCALESRVCLFDSSNNGAGDFTDCRFGAFCKNGNGRSIAF